MKSSLFFLLLFVVCFLVSCGDSAPPPIQVGSPPYLYVSTSNGTIAAFKIKTDGSLSAVAGSPFANPGLGATGLAVANASLVFVANSGSNNISGFTFDAQTGGLSSVFGSPFQALPIVHPSPPVMLTTCQGMLFSLSNNGSASVYAIGSAGLQPRGGFGNFTYGTTRGMVMDPTCKHLYFALPDIDGITFYNYTGTGFPFQNSYPPITTVGTMPVALAMDSAGRFLFAADAGSNDVSVYSVDPTTGVLTRASGSPFPAGPSPSAIAVYGSYVYVTNAGASTSSNTITAFSFDGATGALATVPGSPFPTANNPQIIIPSPIGNNILVGHAAGISVYSIGSNGALQQIAGSPFAVGGIPQGMVVAVGPQ
jgi:DNA-binding beta-propeller fold protein YncE